MTNQIPISLNSESAPNLRVIFTEPSSDDLLHCDLWCMYMYPDELDELEQWGYPRDFLLEKLVQPLSTSNDHPVYPIPANWTPIQREWIYLKIEVECADFGGDWIDAFATFIDGDLRSVNIFWSSEPLVFLLYPMEVFWNTDSFKAITGREPNLPFIELRIRAGRTVSWAPLPATVQIPMVETDDEEQLEASPHSHAA